MEVLLVVNSSEGTKAAQALIEAFRRKGHKASLCHDNNRTRFYDHLADIVFRWGSSASIPLNGAIEVNSPEAIINTGNKTYCRHRLLEAGLPAPKTWYDIQKAEVPFIIRPDSHSQGRQFRVVEKKSDKVYHEHLKNYYCMEIIDKAAEYRVHVMGDNAFAVYNKNITPGELLANQAQTGRKWSEVTDYDNHVMKYCSISITACKTMGLFTGAVDVMIDKNLNPFIAEINTMPNIKTNALADKYVDALKIAYNLGDI